MTDGGAILRRHLVLSHIQLRSTTVCQGVTRNRKGVMKPRQGTQKQNPGGVLCKNPLLPPQIVDGWRIHYPNSSLWRLQDGWPFRYHYATCAIRQLEIGTRSMTYKPYDQRVAAAVGTNVIMGGGKVTRKSIVFFFVWMEHMARFWLTAKILSKEDRCVVSNGEIHLSNISRFRNVIFSKKYEACSIAVWAK